jgi:hypothetical protein
MFHAISPIKGNIIIRNLLGHLLGLGFRHERSGSSGESGMP